VGNASTNKKEGQRRKKGKELNMKITISLKKATKTSICKGLLKTFNSVTDVKIFGQIITCIIPDEPIAPGGMIESIYDTLGGRQTVKSIVKSKG
jgi:hypothetical protein